MRDGWDDEQLMAALREAMRARQAVPDWFVETGRSAYAWHNIDAELAQLTYDSSRDTERTAVTRSENASIRALTFASPHLRLELEVSGHSLLGQVIPPQAGTLETHTRAGVTTFSSRRDRLLRGRPHPGQPVPPALSHGGRDRRGDGMDHAVSRRVQPAPSVTRETAVACWTGSAVSPRRTLYSDSARVWPARRCRCRSTISGTTA